MLVRATFMLAERTNVLAVPAEAVASRPDGSRTVFVVEGDVARQRKVKTGLEGGGWIEIMEGLSERDKVIVQGFEKLKDGAPIALPGKGPKPPKSERAAEAPKGQR
jgi:multidrug efflux pump subunit AcrA (membrane-fusion protein)